MAWNVKNEMPIGRTIDGTANTCGCPNQPVNPST